VAIRALKDSRISPWPDGATFAKVAWNVAADATGVVHAGSFRQFEFMVKDAAKYASTEGWGWGRWLGAELKPYGDSPVFTGECTRCHAPMHRNDYVFTMPIRSAAARADLLNTEALPSDDFPEHPLEWRVITLFVDKRAATLSTVYGNALAVEHARDGSPGPYPPGAALARVTWSEREDPYWFGARIPGRVRSARLITVGESVDRQPTYNCQEHRDGAPRDAPSASCAPDPVGSLLSEATLPTVSGK
jgi:Cytochrome P460